MDPENQNVGTPGTDAPIQGEPKKPEVEQPVAEPQAPQVPAEGEPQA